MNFLELLNNNVAVDLRAQGKTDFEPLRTGKGNSQGLKS